MVTSFHLETTYIKMSIQVLIFFGSEEKIEFHDYAL
jgi:hypothetical protein